MAEYPQWDCLFCLFTGGRHVPAGEVVECRCSCHDEMYAEHQRRLAHVR